MPLAIDYYNQSLESKTVFEQPYASAKDKAINAMRELEGWCTETKAAILVDLVLESKPLVVVEIGVFGGKSLVPMAIALKENGFGKIYGIDPWSTVDSVAEMDEANKAWWGQVNHDKVMSDLIMKIYKFGLKDQIELIRKTSEQTPPIKNINILHIDGNHSEKNSCYDLKKWVPMVKEGGYIIFDDIYWSTTPKAVAWLDENCIRVADFKDGCGWGIWIKKTNQED